MWMIVHPPAEPTRTSLVEADPAGGLSLRAGPRGAEGDPWSGMTGIDGIAHVLPNGGEVVRQSVRAVDAVALEELAGAEGFLPEDDRRILRRAQRALERFPDATHVLLCDTAFFAALPPEAALYAVPRRLSGQGIRRAGGDGLVHEWVWRQVADRWPSTASRLVSLRLGDRTNVAAIRDGAPVDTSVGITPAEGLPSSTASGDVDPTLVFELHSQGYSLEEIYDLLSRGSGFSGYCDRPTGLLDLLRRGDPVTAEVRRVFFYSLAKYLGASLSALGGADCLAISAEAGWDAYDAVTEVCESLAFLGVRIAPPCARSGEEPAVLSVAGSTIMVVFFPVPRWKVLYERARMLQ